MKRILYGGLVLILLTWIYMYCFLGIYENSYDCLIVNLVLSVVYSLIVSHLVYLLSVSIRKCVIPKDQKEKDEEKEKRKRKGKCNCDIKMFIKEKIFYISELFNPQYKYFCFCCLRKSCFTNSVCKYLSCFCSFICCCWWNEKNIEEYVNKKDIEERRKKREEKDQEREEKEQERKEQEQKEKEERNKNEKNLHEKDEDDKKSKSESEKTSVSVYPSKQQFMKK